jgi:hypothetical protein
MTVNITRTITIDIGSSYVCEACTENNKRIGVDDIGIMTAYRFLAGRPMFYPNIQIKYCPICGSDKIHKATEEEQKIIKENWEKDWERQDLEDQNG